MKLKGKSVKHQIDAIQRQHLDNEVLNGFNKVKPLHEPFQLVGYSFPFPSSSRRYIS